MEETTISREEFYMLLAPLNSDMFYDEETDLTRDFKLAKWFSCMSEVFDFMSFNSINEKDVRTVSFKVSAYG
ncbi:hypothetical protein PP935_gp042 [Rhizobium phage RHph_N34]|uniref:Uncharacterized protein n=1 Tax=Rhizobium phage RHph_N34 TaxID=2509586 RepID=A0A7S5R9X0_9CAUD|nr:hypothetical protein PP935_gp042 [Rhizobium phage RHph_N34]QIG73817.1 hypothetical protein EVC06_042 [Rhizobium phage RHph_N34]